MSPDMRQMNFRICLAVLACLFIFVSCKKDDPLSYSGLPRHVDFPKCNDEKIPKSPDSPIGWEFTSKGASYRFPCFNPNNSDEFVYCVTQSGITNLISYNRQSGEKTILLTYNLYRPALWGTNGWILLNPGNQIWKIRDNGDSLTQLTSVGNHYYPSWNFDYTKFVCEFNNIGLTQDFYSGATDLIQYPIKAGSCWLNESNLLAFFDSDMTGVERGFTIIEMNTKTPTFYPVKERYASGSPPIWFNKDIFIFSSHNLLCAFDIKTCDVREIGKTCDNDFFGYGSFAPSTNEIIYEVNHSNYIGSNRIEVTSRFVILNLIDGTVQDLTP